MTASSQMLGRFTVWDSSLPISALGGGCPITGKPVTPGQRFVETGFEVTDSTPNGDLCLAVEYVEEMARGVGMVDLKHHETLGMLYAEAVEEIDTLRAELAYREAVGPEAVAISELADKMDEMLSMLANPKPGRKITAKSET